MVYVRSGFPLPSRDWFGCGGNKDLTTNILWVYTDVCPALLVSSRFIVTLVQTPVLVQFQGVIAETGGHVMSMLLDLVLYTCNTLVC